MNSCRRRCWRIVGTQEGVDVGTVVGGDVGAIVGTPEGLDVRSVVGGDVGRIVGTVEGKCNARW